MSRELDIEEIDRICGIIGRRVHSRFPGTPAEDLSQEVWVWVAQHEEEVLEWTSERQEGLPDTTGSTARLYRRGFRVATAYARREKAAATGYEPHDEFWYSIGMLRRVLPLWFEERLPESPDKLIIPDRDIVLDLNVAFPQLSPEQSSVLRAMFEGDPEERRTYDDIADYWRVTSQSAEKKVQRALGALQELLGGPNPYEHPGRKAISNATARAITAQSFEA